MIDIDEKWLGRWEAFSKLGKCNMVNPTVFTFAAKLLDRDGIETIADWGCGHGRFQDYIINKHKYIGIDGSKTSPGASIVADLRKSPVRLSDAIFMRGVLEHNDDWEQILDNFLNSFNKLAILVIWSPLVETHITSNKRLIPVHCFTFDEIVRKFKSIKFNCVFIPNHKQRWFESCFCLKKDT